jgi:hypothetical protein
MQTTTVESSNVKAEQVLKELGFKQEEIDVIRAMAENLGDTMTEYLTWTIKASVQGTLENPDICGEAFSKRQLKIWSKANPKA